MDLGACRSPADPWTRAARACRPRRRLRVSPLQTGAAPSLRGGASCESWGAGRLDTALPNTKALPLGPLTPAHLPGLKASAPPPTPHRDLRSPGAGGVTHVFSFPAEH